MTHAGMGMLEKRLRVQQAILEILGNNHDQISHSPCVDLLKSVMEKNYNYLPTYPIFKVKHLRENCSVVFL